VKIDKNKFEEFIQRFKAPIEGNLMVYIPDRRVKSFILAIKAYYDQLEYLPAQIEMILKNEYRRKSVAFRVLIFIMMGIFRVNMNQMVKLLNCTKNTMLKKFIIFFQKKILYPNKKLAIPGKLLKNTRMILLI